MNAKRCVACLLVDLVGAHLLDALGLVEGLLAPSGSRLFVLIPLSCLFYGARLFSYFVVPGVLLSRLLQGLSGRHFVAGRVRSLLRLASSTPLRAAPASPRTRVNGTNQSNRGPGTA